MSEEKIYPSMVIRSQAEAIELLEKENQQLKEDLHQASISIQEMVEMDIMCPTNCDKLNKYKSVLDEIREVIIELRNIIYNPDYENFGLSREQYKDRFIHIFEILDKVNINPNDMTKMFENCTTLEPFLEYIDKVKEWN